MPTLPPGGSSGLRPERGGGRGATAAPRSGGPIRRPRAWWRAASSGQRRVAVLAAFLLLVGTALAVWWGLAATVGKPAWRDLAYDVRDERTVVVRYELTKPPALSVRCVIVAKEVNHGTVGRVEDITGPTEQTVVRRQVTVRTTSLAVIGMVDSCRGL